MAVITKEKKGKGPPGNQFALGNNGGRPKSDIDWKKVDELLEAGCSGVEIAANIGVSCPTLYDRCQTDNNKLFSEYSQEKQSKGDSILRKVQFDKALTGDNTILIWLGKCRLKQKEHEDQVITKEVEAKFDQLMKQMQKDKESIPHNNDSGSIIPETA